VRPLVLASLGSTYQRQEQPLRRVAQALGALPVRGLVTLGDVFSPSELAPAENVVAVRSAPHAAILPRASAVVAHGGHGTVMKALAAGLPVVCVPLGRDQKDVAARVVGIGAGLSVGRDASVARLRRAIARVLDEPRFRENARRLADTLAAERARDAAVEALEQLAKSRAQAAAPIVAAV
jgi:MGT family glycosyltransferase